MRPMQTIAILGLLSPFSVAQTGGSGFTQVSPFVGTHWEPFEDFSGSSPPCVAARVFQDHGDLCSLDETSGITICLSAGSACTIYPHQGGRFATCAGSGVVFTLDTPVTRFGAFFGSNFPGCTGGTIRFYDGTGGLLYTDSVIAPLDCQWHWNGWDTGGAFVERIEIEYNTTWGGVVDMDEAHADFYPPRPGIPFCYCDGSGAAAPCGNYGYTGGGCLNHSFDSGAQLSASGVPSVSNSSLVLFANYLTPAGPGVFFQGNYPVGAGAGNPFGDGLRCIGGGVVRLQRRQWSFGSSTETTVNIPQVPGNHVLPGDTKLYQFWYRTINAPCGTTVSTSNGLRITWEP